MAHLKATVMQADLERLGHWDRAWARQRFLDTARVEADRTWIEAFYLEPRIQGHGVDGSVLGHVMALHPDARPFWLAIDRGSRVRPLYEKLGFTYQYDDDNSVDQLFSADAAAQG